MLNWYRAVLRYRPPAPTEIRLRMPVLMLWGKQDVALAHEMARPSIELCDDGKLVLFSSNRKISKSSESTS